MVLKKRIIVTLAIFVSMLSVFLYSSNNAVAAYEGGSGQITNIQQHAWGSSKRQTASTFNLKDSNGHYYSGMCVQHTYNTPSAGSMTYRIIPNDSLTAKGLAYGMENGYFNTSDNTKIGIMSIAMTFLFAEDERQYGFRSSLGGKSTVDPKWDAYWYPDTWYANGVTKAKVDEFIRNAKNYRVSKFAKLGVCLNSNKKGQTIGFFKEFSNERDDELRLWKFTDRSGSQVGLTGATFGIYNPDGSLNSKLDITDSTYGNRITGLKTNIEYTIKELKAPDGYSKDYSKYTYYSDGQRIVIKRNKKPYLTFLKDSYGDYKLENNNTGFSVNSENYLYIKNKVSKPGEYSLKFKKVDSESKTPLANANFSIIRESDYNKGDFSKPLIRLTSGSDGYANFSIKDLQTNETDDLTADNYVLVETSAPSGYTKANHKLKFVYDFDEDKFNVEISDMDGSNKKSGEEVNVENTKFKTNIKIVKKRTNTNTRIQGVKFKIVAMDTASQLKYKYSEEVVTDENGIATISKARPGYLYRIYEKAVPKDYAGNEGKTIGFFSLITDNVIQMYGTGKFTDNSFYDDNGAIKKEFLDEFANHLGTAEMTSKVGNIENKQSSELVEYSTTVDGTNVNNTILINNEKTRKNLKLIKKDFNTNKPIANVEFELKDKDGQTIEKAKTNENGELVFEGLANNPDGYTIVETENNSGSLVKNKPFKFKLVAGEFTTIGDSANDQMFILSKDNEKDMGVLEIKNKTKTRISISKKDAEHFDNKDNLIGASFDLYKYDSVTNTKGNLVTRFTTEQYKDSKFEVENGLYILEETSAPLGFKQDKGCYIIAVEDIKFNEADGKYQSGVKCFYLKDKTNIEKSSDTMEAVDITNQNDININNYNTVTDKNISFNFKIKNYEDDSVMLPDTGGINKYQPIFLIGIILSVLCVFAAKNKTRKA